MIVFQEATRLRTGILQCSCRVPRHDPLMKPPSPRARCCNWLGTIPDKSTYWEKKSVDNSPVMKNLRAVKDEKLDSSWQCQIQAHPRLHRKQCGQQVKVDDSVPLLCPCATPPGTLRPAWDPQHKKDMDLLKCVQRRTMKMMEYLCSKDCLRAGVIQPGERKAFSSLRGGYKNEEEGLFTWADSDRKRDNDFKLKKSTFRLDVRKNFFAQRLEQMAQRN